MPEPSAAAVEVLRFKPNPRDPSIQIVPTLGPKVCKYDLHWALLLGSLG